MAHPSRAELEAENVALRRQIREIQHERDDERRKRDNTQRGYESLVHNITENIAASGAGPAGSANREFIDDILKQTDREKENLQHKIQDLEQRLKDEWSKRGALDYGSAGQLRALQRELDTIKEDKIELEHKFYEEKRKSNELQRRLDNPLPNERANRVERDNEFLRHDKWKLEEKLKEEKRISEEWRRKYEQAAYPRHNPVEDDLRRRIDTLNQQVEDLKRERGIFQMKVRQVVEEMEAKLHSQGLRYDEMQQAYQSERRDKENLKKRLDDIGQVSQVQALNDDIARLQKEVIELRKSKGKITSDLEDSQYKLEIEEKRTKDYGAKVEEMAHEIRSLEHQKKRTEIKLEAVLNEKQEIETKLHNKRENEEKHQPGQQQILHDDLEKENQRLKNILRRYEDHLRSAKDLGPLTAEVERLEEEKKALRNDCDKYCEDNEQLRKQIESFYTGRMSQGLSSVDAMLQENMKRMERDKEYLKRKLEDAVRESDDLREQKVGQKKKDDSKIQSLIMERKKLEGEIDKLNLANVKLKEQVKKQESSLEHDEFDKIKYKEVISFSHPIDEPQSIVKKGSYSDELHLIDADVVTPSYEDLLKMKKELKELHLGVISLKEKNRRREEEN
ncbi:PREDICTED: intracellular protein transport protein USO1-like [Amphimedon queenslandica]|uniref:Uncharacterized protein n=2 Tax=Amphimedon queenslandica TaxID=400682 RepID=A0AAN0JJG1_AMPQE|nr:PREDICTED: intracellular protein transport protein USO1-like [Amphimedon queenslandica]|eukprot:XP_019857170.1 PREDICTED: intracellular protein transport protein USO1-like [Amphimedon queenslandica]